jgi:uncharacterized membrane protein
MIKTLLITGICVLLLWQGCTKDKGAPVLPCDSGKVYFRNDILPIINSNCAKSGCHDAVTQAEETNLSNYKGVLKIVKPGKPARSKLMEVINSTGEESMPPPPYTPLTDEQKNLISRWISEGARDIRCAQDTANCTATGISFSKDIEPIIKLNCVGCHSNSIKNGGVDLSSYYNVHTEAASGKLYNSVAHNGSARPMPPSLQLGTCDIKKIKAWIDEGMSNN